jgi:hypothetical protein
MQDKHTFEYAIIRIVPKVEREEFFNVGVLLFSKRKKFLGIQFHIDTTKLKVLAPGLEIDVLNENLYAWKLICEGKDKGGTIGALEISDRFRWLAACRSTMIQSSKTHPGLSEDPEKELNVLFEAYVL